MHSMPCTQTLILHRRGASGLQRVSLTLGLFAMTWTYQM